MNEENKEIRISDYCVYQIQIVGIIITDRETSIFGNNKKGRLRIYDKKFIHICYFA
jgi:hypothetical protein